MPTATQMLSLIERCSFFAYAGCCGTSECGSARRSSILGRLDIICGVRLTIQHTLPRHSTLIFWPGSTFEMSISTGAPAAFARSLGQNDITKGVATATAPMPPTTQVAVTRNRRLPLAIVASVSIRRVLAFVCRVSLIENEPGSALETGLARKTR